MTFVLAFYELNFVSRWRCVCYGMPSSSEFAFLKKTYGLENIRFTSDVSLVQKLDFLSSSDYED